MKEIRATSTDMLVCLVLMKLFAIIERISHLWPFSTFFVFGKIVGNTFVICLRWVFYGLAICAHHCLGLSHTKRFTKRSPNGQLNSAKAKVEIVIIATCIHNSSVNIFATFMNPIRYCTITLFQILFDYRKEIGPAESK